MDLKVVLNSLLAEYHRHHDLQMVPIKINYLRPMIEDRGFIDNINWEKFHFPAQHIVALIKTYKAEMGVYAGTGDYARIQYSSDLNFCWTRFVIAKEMCHCLIDEGEDERITSSNKLMKLGESLVSDDTATLPEFPPYITERNAEFLAVETLFPLELRKSHVAEYNAGQITTYQLALRYRIPEYYTGVAMMPNYMEAVQEWRGDENLVTF